ncbi:MAG: hypothetical protein WBM14_00425, partial [Terracidiphilus sp.]
MISTKRKTTNMSRLRRFVPLLFKPTPAAVASGSAANRKQTSPFRGDIFVEIATQNISKLRQERHIPSACQTMSLLRSLGFLQNEKLQICRAYGASLLWLPAVKGQPQHFHHFPGNQVSAFVGDLALLVVEARFGQQMNLVAADHGFPIQTIGLVQCFLGGFRAPVHFGRGAKQGVDFFNIRILAGFIIGNDDGGMPPFLAERKHVDVPLPHGVPFLFKVFGGANHRGFGQTIVLLNFGPAVGVGEIVRRTDGDRLDLR